MAKIYSLMEMRDFLETAMDVSKEIKDLDERVEKYRKLILEKQTKILNREDEYELNNKIEALNIKINSRSEKIKSAIKRNKEETLYLKGTNMGRDIISIRELHTFGHGKELSSVLGKYQDIQYKYKRREKERVKEAYLIANPKAGQKELDELMYGKDGETVLASAFALGSHSAKGILDEAKDRMKRIDKIVESINTIVSLINEIDKIVKMESSVVDNISINMTSAEVHTSQANKELNSALRYQRRVMFLKRLFFGFFIVLLALLLGYVVFRVVHNSGGSNSNKN